MKCPKCNFISFDYFDTCKKCGRDLTEDKARLGIRSIKKRIPESFAVPCSETEAPDVAEQGKDSGEDGFSFDLGDAEKVDNNKEEGSPPSEDENLSLPFKDMEGLRKGGFFKRLLAYTVDNIIQIIIVYLFLIAGIYALKKGVSVSGESLSVEHIAGLAGPLVFLAVIVNAGYFTFFHWAAGQTPGKMLFGLKVVRKGGGAVGFSRSFIRWVGYNLSALPLMQGFLIALVDKQNQTLHDKIAGTYVIDVNALAKVEEYHNVDDALQLESDEV